MDNDNWQFGRLICFDRYVDQIISQGNETNFISYLLVSTPNLQMKLYNVAAYYFFLLIVFQFVCYIGAFMMVNAWYFGFHWPKQSLVNITNSLCVQMPDIVIYTR